MISRCLLYIYIEKSKFWNFSHFSRKIQSQCPLIMTAKMIFGEPWEPKASWHLPCRWKKKKKTSKEPHPGNLSKPRIEPGPAMWQARMLPPAPQRWTLLEYLPFLNIFKWNVALLPLIYQTIRIKDTDTSHILSRVYCPIW